jgi:hypothetical protein
MKKFSSLVLVAFIFTTSNVFALNNGNTVNSNQNNQPVQNSIQYQNATRQILQNQQQFLHNNEALQKQLNEANQNFQELIDSQR